MLGKTKDDSAHRVTEESTARRLTIEKQVRNPSSDSTNRARKGYLLLSRREKAERKGGKGSTNSDTLSNITANLIQTLKSIQTQQEYTSNEFLSSLGDLKIELTKHRAEAESDYTRRLQGLDVTHKQLVNEKDVIVCSIHFHHTITIALKLIRFFSFFFEATRQFFHYN